MEKQLTPLNSLSQIREGLSKKQVADLAEYSVDAVLESGNVTQVAEAVAIMDEFVKAVRKDERFIQFMRDELIKHHGNINTQSGARIELCEAGVSYDYSEDPAWCLIDARMKALAAQRKALEEKLKIIGPGRIEADRETGEIKVGALKSSRSTYRITLAK